MSYIQLNRIRDSLFFLPLFQRIKNALGKPGIHPLRKIINKTFLTRPTGEVTAIRTRDVPYRAKINLIENKFFNVGGKLI